MEMTQAGGAVLDRRSLIKKGLVAGGVVATAPVITTFNAPAFAASQEFLRVQFSVNVLSVGQILTLAQVNRVTPSANACGAIEVMWDAAVNASENLVVSHSTSDDLVFTIVTPGFRFVDVRSTNCTAATLTDTTASFPMAFVTLTLGNWPYFLLIEPVPSA